MTHSEQLVTGGLYHISLKAQAHGLWTNSAYQAIL